MTTDTDRPNASDMANKAEREAAYRDERRAELLNKIEYAISSCVFATISEEVDGVDIAAKAVLELLVAEGFHD